MYKMKELKSKGLGSKKNKNRADPFTADEIQMLYSKGELGAGKLSNCTLIF